MARPPPPAKLVQEIALQNFVLSLVAVSGISMADASYHKLQLLAVKLSHYLDENQ